MQTREIQQRLALHGALILLIGFACGLPAVAEVSSGSGRMWQGGHSALLILGVWLLAMPSVTPLLVLAAREARALPAALLLMAWSFTVAVIAQAVLGERALGPSSSPVLMATFIANVLAVLGAFVSAALIAMGAWNALHPERTPLRRPAT